MTRTIATVIGSLIIAMVLGRRVRGGSQPRRIQGRRRTDLQDQREGERTDPRRGPQGSEDGQAEAGGGEVRPGLGGAGGALRELEALPQPAADEARLAKWFSYLKIEAELFATAGKKLKSGDKPGAEHIITKLTQNANKANLQVLPFGFRYCRLEPSKFT